MKNTKQTTSRAMMSAIAKASLDALITIDYEGKIVEFSPVAESMFGYQRDEVIGVSVAEIVIPPRLRQAHTDGMAKYHRSGQGPVINNRIEVPAIRRNGEEFPAELTVVPLEIEEGKFFTAFVRDITELKAQQKATELARQAAEDANRAKSRFLAHMSHELRSPLTTVLGAVDLLLDSQLNKDQQQFAALAQSSGESLLDLISDILDFSRIESGQLVLNEQDIDLHALLNNLTDTYARKAFSKNLDFATYIDPQVPVTIRCDAKRLRQILTNYLDNALKFTREGGVMLQVETVRLTKHKAQLRFCVRDTGDGLSAKHAKSIFNEFTQVDNSDSTAYSGAGLGLAIVKLIADSMNARVGVNHRLKTGCEFWLDVKFPYQKKPSQGMALQVPAHVFAILCQPMTAECVKRQLADIGAKTTMRKRLDSLTSDTAKRADLQLIDLQAAGIPADTFSQWLSDHDLDSRKVCLLLTPDEASELARSPKNQPCHIITKPVHEPGLRDLIQQVRGSGHTKKDSSAAESGKKRILLAEDSPSNQLVLSAILQSAEYDVSVVENGKQAVDAIANNSYDLVLMDLRMPVMDGLEATRTIRQLASPQKNIRILALTANALQEDIDRCLAAGMDDFSSKPVIKHALLSKIADLLGR